MDQRKERDREHRHGRYTADMEEAIREGKCKKKAERERESTNNNGDVNKEIKRPLYINTRGLKRSALRNEDRNIVAWR